MANWHSGLVAKTKWFSEYVLDHLASSSSITNTFVLEMQVLRQYTRLPESETLDVDQATCFNAGDSNARIIKYANEIEHKAQK